MLIPVVDRPCLALVRQCRKKNCAMACASTTSCLMVPALAFLSSWPFSRSRLAAGVREYGLPLVDHLCSMRHPPFQLLFSFEGWPPHHLCDPSVPSLQIVDGSRVTSLATLQFSPSLLSTLEFDGQPWVPHCPIVAGPFARLSSPWRSFPGTLPLVFLPLIRDGRHCGWHGAPRLLSLVRYRGVGWTLLIDL